MTIGPEPPCGEGDADRLTYETEEQERIRLLEARVGDLDRSLSQAFTSIFNLQETVEKQRSDLNYHWLTLAIVTAVVAGVLAHLLQLVEG